MAIRILRKIGVLIVLALGVLALIAIAAHT